MPGARHRGTSAPADPHEISGSVRRGRGRNGPVRCQASVTNL